MIFKTNKLSRVVCGALPLAACTALTANAQLEEIVVTAQKRQESMQQVPIAVSAITGQYIENQNITNLSGLNNTLPNVQINTFSNSPDSAVFTIRGVGVNDADPYVGTTVSVVVDGAVVGVNTAALLSLFDIERVEVLRGPQGTLFGANTTGGVINVITKQPTGEYGGEAQVTAGEHGRLDANLAYNFPINENWAGKVSLLHTSHDGYFSNTLNGTDLGSTDVTSLRGYLKYTGDNYDATVKAQYVRSRNGSQTNLNISDSSMILFEQGRTSDEPRFRRGQSAGVPDQNDRDTYSLTLTQNFMTDIGDITAITDYRQYDHDLFSDDDATIHQWLQTHREVDHYQFSQEIRNTMDISDNIELLVGVYGLYQEYELDQEGQLDGFFPGLSQPQTQEQENWSASLFAQTYIDITDRLQFQLGIRYSHEETEATSTTAQYLALGRPAEFGDRPTMADVIALQPQLVVSGEDEWDNVGYKIGLDYQLTDQVMVYGYHARGFKSGGFVGRIAIPQDIGPFDTEFLDTWEVGMKSDLFDNRVRLNLAAFYNEYEDMQVVQNLTLASGANSSTIQNAGEAHSQGVEMELTAYATDDLVFNLAVAYLDSEYDKYDTLAPDLNNPAAGPVPTDLSGNPLMNAPRWSGNVSATYTVPIGAGEGRFFLQTTHASEKFSNFTAYPQEKVGEITLVNARVSWTPDSDRWTLGVYGRNLADKEYLAQRQWFFPSFGIASMGPPREVGVDFKFNW
jgi:iron complex outermembrane receptor protein